jgi:hypothetical protein
MNPLDFTFFRKIQNTQIFAQYIKKVISSKLPLNQIYGSQPLELIVSNDKNVENMRVEKIQKG